MCKEAPAGGCTQETFFVLPITTFESALAKAHASPLSGGARVNSHEGYVATISELAHAMGEFSATGEISVASAGHTNQGRLSRGRYADWANTYRHPVGVWR